MAYLFKPYAIIYCLTFDCHFRPHRSADANINTTSIHLSVVTSQLVPLLCSANSTFNVAKSSINQSRCTTTTSVLVTK